MGIRLAVGNESPVEFNVDEVLVGTDPNCHIPLSGDSRLHPRHLVIKRVADRWIAEAGSSEPIQVGSSRPGKMGWLKPGDVIKLTASGPELTFEPATTAGHPQAAPTPPRPTTSPIQSYNPRPQPTPILSASTPPPAAPSALRHDTPMAPQPAVQTPPEAKALPLGRRFANPPVVWSAAAVVVIGIILLAISLRGPSGKGGPSPAPVPPKIEDALYTILVKSPTLPDTYQVGTAWAVSAHRLVTSAGVANELDKLRKRFPELSVFCPSTGETLVVNSYRYHPEFLRAVDALDRAADDAGKLQSELDEARNKATQLEKAGDDAQPAGTAAFNLSSLTELEAKLKAADERYDKVESLPWFHDIAILEVRETMPSFLEVAERSAVKPQEGDKLTILGLPVKEKQVIWYSDEPIKPQETAGSIFGPIAPEQDRFGLLRWLVKSRADLSGQCWYGSPVLNEERKVVAIYSRPAPLPDASQTATNHFHEAVDIAPLREMLPDAK